MTTQNPAPVSLAKPQIVIEAGRLYQPGSINLLTPEMVAKVTCPEGYVVKHGRPHFADFIKGVNLDGGGNAYLLYGLLVDTSNEVCGYPIKPGTYPFSVTLYCEGTDDDGKTVQTGAAYVSAELVVSGVEVGNWYDRNVVHHSHPTMDTILANTGTLKEILDGHTHQIGLLKARVTALEPEQEPAPAPAEDSSDDC